MKKERYCSFAHLLGMAFLVSMLCTATISTIMTIARLILSVFSENSIVQYAIKVTMEQEILKSIILDLSGGERFSIIFTAVFFTITIFMSACTLKYALESVRFSIITVLAYVTLTFVYLYVINLKLSVNKADIFWVELISLLICAIVLNPMQNVLWTSMDKPPKYQFCSLFSIIMLAIIIAVTFVMIDLLTYGVNYLTSVLFSNLLNLPSIELLLTKIVTVIKWYLFMIVWGEMGNLHDHIIVKELEEGGIR